MIKNTAELKRSTRPYLFECGRPMEKPRARQRVAYYDVRLGYGGAILPPRSQELYAL